MNEKKKLPDHLSRIIGPCDFSNNGKLNMFFENALRLHHGMAFDNRWRLIIVNYILYQ